MPEEMAKVAARSSVPIATGERLCTKYEFARILRCGAAAILQPNLGLVGGILEGRKIAAIAETYYAQIAPHLYCGPVVAAANIQLATAILNFLILESIQKMDGFHAALLETPLCWEDGYVIPPTSPGLGVTLIWRLSPPIRGTVMRCINRWDKTRMIQCAMTILAAANDR
jgi:galactonate dehydratase